MKDTGAIFTEPVIAGEKGERFTNDVCNKHCDNDYQIDRRSISLSVHSSNSYRQPIQSCFIA